MGDAARARQAIRAGHSLILTANVDGLHLSHGDTQAAFDAAEAETAELLGVTLDGPDTNFAALSGWKQLKVFTVLDDLVDWQEKVDRTRSRLRPMRWQDWSCLPPLPRSALLLLGWLAWPLAWAGAQLYSNDSWFRLYYWTMILYIALAHYIAIYPAPGGGLLLFVAAVALLVAVCGTFLADATQLQQHAAELRSCRRSARQVHQSQAALPGLCQMASAMDIRLGACAAEAKRASARAAQLFPWRRLQAQQAAAAGAGEQQG